MIQEFQHLGFTHIGLENDTLRVVFLPEIGGKMTRLENKITGTQFLLEPQNDGGKYSPAGYGADFEQFDTSGFDECFPTIEASEYRRLSHPEKLTNIYIPDHGELWSRPWDYDITDEILTLSITGFKFQYTLTKKLFLRDNRVVIKYSLTNDSVIPLTYLWSAHPLLKIKAGTELMFADKINEVFINWASDTSIGAFGDKIPWPLIGNNGQTIDYSVVQPQNLNQAMKVFTYPLRTGLAGVYHPQQDEALLFHFDPIEIPYLGLWLCYGGWPEESEQKHFTIGIEPTNGRPDSLSEAVKRGECVEIDAHKAHNWALEMSIWQGKPDVRKFHNSSSST